MTPAETLIGLEMESDQKIGTGEIPKAFHKIKYDTALKKERQSVCNEPIFKV